MNVEIQHSCATQDPVIVALYKSMVGMVPEGVAIELDDAMPDIIGDIIIKANIPIARHEHEQSRDSMLRKYPLAIRQLLELQFREFDRQAAMMLDRVQRIMQDKADPLAKGLISRHGQPGLEEYWRPYGIEAIKRIAEVVGEHIDALAYRFFKSGMIKQKLNSLVERGIILDKRDVTDVIQDTYVLARAVDAMDRGIDLENAIRIAYKRPLTPKDMEAIKWARERAGVHMRGLQNDLVNAVERIMADRGTRGAEYDIEREQMLSELESQRKREVSRQIARAKMQGMTWQETATELKHLWGDFTRDWERVAYTEFGYLEKWGRARNYMERFGPDVRVVKYPRAGACKVCKLLYENADGSPRVFTLSELMEYGSNGFKWLNPKTNKYENRRASRIRYDKKSGKFDADTGGLVPTIGPVHPWCGCLLMLYTVRAAEEIPKIMQDDPELKHHYDRIRSKMNVRKAVLNVIAQRCDNENKVGGTLC